MKWIMLCVVAMIVVAYARPDDKYTDKYDGTNVQEILDNDRLFDTYFKCVMDQGKCTPDGNELKSHIIDALETHCAKCTDVQQKEVRRVASHLINKKPDQWNQLSAKYDPSKKYATMYEKEVKELKE